jgi:hypothetical protein
MTQVQMVDCRLTVVYKPCSPVLTGFSMVESGRLSPAMTDNFFFFLTFKAPQVMQLDSHKEAVDVHAKSVLLQWLDRASLGKLQSI